jgi:catalase
MVSHLIHVDNALADKVAYGLRLNEMPEAPEAAQPVREGLAKSPPLSIVSNGPESFAGRRLGVLATDGSDPALFTALKQVVTDEGAALKLIAPRIGGVEMTDGSLVPADEKIDGGPSVLFDAVVLLVSAEGAEQLANESTARDFVADAFAHLKFIGYVDAAKPLLQKAGVMATDEGVVLLKRPSDAASFVQTCRKLRVWARAPKVKQF